MGCAEAGWPCFPCCCFCPGSTGGKGWEPSLPPLLLATLPISGEWRQFQPENRPSSWVPAPPPPFPCPPRVGFCTKEVSWASDCPRPHPTHLPSGNCPPGAPCILRMSPPEPRSLALAAAQPCTPHLDGHERWQYTSSSAREARGLEFEVRNTPHPSPAGGSTWRGISKPSLAICTTLSLLSLHPNPYTSVFLTWLGSGG